MKKSNVIGIPINCMDRYPKGLLSDHASQYSFAPSPSNEIFKIRKSRANSAILGMNKFGEWMDNFLQGIQEHVKLGPKLTETLKGKLRLGARILQVGGLEKVLKQNFSFSNGEKLLKASQCYLSTTAGPIAGLLFISTDKVAFRSERSIKLASPTGKQLKIHYKVMIPVGKIKRAYDSKKCEKTKAKVCAESNRGRVRVLVHGISKSSKGFQVSAAGNLSNSFSSSY